MNTNELNKALSVCDSQQAELIRKYTSYIDTQIEKRCKDVGLDPGLVRFGSEGSVDVEGNKATFSVIHAETKPAA